MSVGASSGALQGAIRDLERLGRRARLLILSRRVIGLAAAAIGCAAIAIALDWLFRFPAPFRAIELLLGAVVFVMASYRLVAPALRFRPTPTQLALRIERSAPGLRGRLASGIEFAMSGTDRDSALAARSVADLAARLSGESIRSWLAPKRSFAELSTAFVTIAVVALLALMLPTHARIGATRLFAPFAGAEWPARTRVESLMGGVTHHAKGQPLLLSARIAQGDAPDERVSALVTIHRDDGTTTSDRLVLTRQSDGRYERVLEADVGIESIDLRFASSDHESQSESITMVLPPAITGATLTLDPPAYAKPTTETRVVDLGDGTDEKATLRDAALVGSSATLAVTLNKPLPTEGDAVEWKSRMLGGAAAGDLALDVDASDASRWRLTWTVAGPSELRITPEDALGIRAVEDARYRIDAVEDRPPTCAVIAPAADESVLPTAVIEAAIEARDDVGLSRAGLVVAKQQGGKGATTTAKEAIGETTSSLERRTESLDLQSLGAAPGDVLTLNAVAEDRFELDGRRHDRVTSAPRTIRIISEIELGKQLRNQLAAVRRSAVRLDAQQAELAAAAQNGRFDPALERSQAQVSERLRAASQAVQELSARAQRNRLDDEDLGATLAQAQDLLDAAGRGSARASEAMQQKREAQAKSPSAESDEEQKRAAEETVAAQEDVRNDLEDLIKLLDRDEDSWAMGREIERLRDVVQKLAERTSKAGERTVGQKPEDLREDDRNELDSISDGQRDAARAAQELIDELRKRAAAVDRVDRSRAEAMREAAKAGEERRLQRNLEQAGDDVQNNRMQQAQSSQQAAMDALDRMRRGLDDVRKARAEELRRALESLERSIERLVKINEDELIALSRVAGPEDEEGLSERSRAMAKLAQNTQAVSEEARAAGSEASRIARTLDRAADSHGGAVGFLRAKPARLPDAQSAEERGLALLNEALEAARQARQQSEQREQAKKLQELVAAYRQLLEKQLGVRDATLVARPKDPKAKLDRRGLIESRRLSIAEGEIGHSMQSMIDEHAELKESPIFVETHALVADWASHASQRLGDGDLSDGTVGVQTQIADAIEQLIASLAQEQPDDNPFQENQAGGNQGNGGGANQGQNQQAKLPPVAELKLLRGMQVQVFERTKRLDQERAQGGGSPEADAEVAALAKLQERLGGLLEKLIQKLSMPPGVAPPEPENPPGGEGDGQKPEEPKKDAPGEPKPECGTAQNDGTGAGHRPNREEDSFVGRR